MTYDFIHPILLTITKENFSDEFFVEISIIKSPEAVRIGVRAHNGHYDVTAAGCGGVLVWSHVRGGEAAAEVSLPSEACRPQLSHV